MDGCCGAPEGTFVLKLELTDSVAPRVLRVGPTGGRVSPKANVAAAFSETMDRATLNRVTVKLVKKGTRRPVAATVTASPDGKRATLNPSRALVRGATYTAAVTTGARDLTGNAIPASRTWMFTVKR